MLLVTQLNFQSAHTCILEFDNNTSLFGVYDGHGSHGTAEQLPKFLKTVESYKHDDLAKALEEALSKFDQTVTESNFGKIHHPIVIAGQLKLLTSSSSIY